MVAIMFIKARIRSVPKAHAERSAPPTLSAIMVGRIAAGEIKDERDSLRSAAAALGRKGGNARAANMTPERRKEIAKKAAAKRWGA
jgi:hypothetical protein